MTTATTLDKADTSSRYRSERDVALRSVTVIAGVVIALTFLFGFGRSRRVPGFLMALAAELEGPSGRSADCPSGSGWV